MKHFLNWSVLRAISETRASIFISSFSIILVPFIAAIWPWISAALGKAFLILLEAEVPLVVGEKIRMDVSEVVTAHGPRAIKVVSDMPLFFAFAFFSSLLFILASILFRVFCPRIVLSYSVREFQDAELERFERFEIAEQAAQAISLVEKMPEAEKSDAFKDFVDGQKRGIPLVGEELAKVRKEIIFSGAQRDYFTQCTETSRPGLYIVGSLFLLSLLLIAWVIVRQALLVISATGLT